MENEQAPTEGITATDYAASAGSGRPTLDSTVQRHIRDWAPAGMVIAGGLGDDPADALADTADTVVFIRRVVEHAAPDQIKKATNALRWGHDYAVWTVSQGRNLDGRVMFEPAAVNTYRKTLTCARGTADAICSYLKRLHPDIGLNGTTRKGTHQSNTSSSTTSGADDATATDNASHVQATALTSVHPTASAIATAVAEWRPETMDAERFERIAPTVRQIVAHVRPSSPERAVALCRCVAYLTAWADTNHLAVRTDALLDGENIEAFIDVITQRLPTRSAATFSSNLHAVRDAHGIPAPAKRRQFPRAAATAPYTEAEIAVIWVQAERIHRLSRRRHTQAALAVLFGVGANPGEAPAIRPGDIVAFNHPETGADTQAADGIHGVLVEAVVVSLIKPVRTVKAYGEQARDLLAAKSRAEAAGDEYLLGGTNRGVSRLNQLLNPGTASRVIGVSAKRARATWLVDACTEEGRYASLGQLLEESGMKTFHQLNDLYPYIRHNRTGPGDTELELIMAHEDTNAGGTHHSGTQTDSGDLVAASTPETGVAA